jgi:hypothetical protein
MVVACFCGYDEANVTSVERVVKRKTATGLAAVSKINNPDPIAGVSAEKLHFLQTEDLN